MFGISSDWMIVIVVATIVGCSILYALYDDWKESKRREEYYQIILKNWKNNIRYVKLDKRKPNHNSMQCIRSYKILDESKDMKDIAEHIELHPLRQHWHIPKNIRKEDFMDFVKTCSKEELEKLIYMYSAIPPTDLVYI